MGGSVLTNASVRPDGQAQHITNGLYVRAVGLRWVVVIALPTFCDGGR